MYQNLIQLFEATVSACPENLALADREESFTFAALRENARKLASILLKKGLGGKVLAVLARHDVWTPLLFLGVLYAGGAYVPLDEEMPAEKQKKILEGSGAAAILCHGESDHGHLPVTKELLNEVCCEETALKEAEANLLCLSMCTAM